MSDRGDSQEYALLPVHFVALNTRVATVWRDGAPDELLCNANAAMIHIANISVSVPYVRKFNGLVEYHH